MDSNTLPFSDWIVEEGRKLGKTLEDLSKELGVSKMDIIVWRNSQDLPDISKLPAIAETYNVDLEELTRLWEISKEILDLEKHLRQAEKPRNPSRPLLYFNPPFGASIRTRERKASWPSRLH